jgi:hypothetical protein
MKRARSVICSEVAWPKDFLQRVKRNPDRDGFDRKAIDGLSHRSRRSLREARAEARSKLGPRLDDRYELKSE